jgi:hypothetical protein
MQTLDVRVRLLPLSLAIGLSACATLPSATAPGTVPAGPRAVTTPAAPAASSAAAPAKAASAPTAGAPAPVPAAPPPFATVIKDAKKVEGVLALWQKDEKLWIELQPEDFGKLYYLSPKIAAGIGEPAAYGGLMARGIGGGAGGPQLVEFRRLHNVVQLVARNTDFTAKPGTPEARAVQAAFSQSLLGGAPVASQPHPQSKSILIDATSIFVSDMLGVGAQLQRTYRQGYGLDARNSAVTRVRGTPELTVIEVQNHYQTSSLSVPQAGMPPGGPAPTMPRTLPDPRSLFVTLHYSLSKLPDAPMAPRRADARVGYFDTVVQDFSDDLARTPKLRYITRWNLQKKDPNAEMSEPVKPITYWLDRTIPDKYRDAIRGGILEWNKAFERIGFKDAIVVKVQPEDADFDTLDVNRASVRWMTNSTVSFGAIGPKHIDPRSGEILDADISIESVDLRWTRSLRSQILITSLARGLPNLPAAATHDGAGAAHDHEHCNLAEHAADQLGYGLDVLAARGDIDPASPEAQQFVLEHLKWLTMHEMGHTLGLRHNFRSSTAYTEQQLSDLEFTKRNGITASVMDYQSINLSRPGQKGGTPFQLTLGPYDYWAIEYGYKPLPQAEERDELKRIASRSGSDRTLVYGTDEDNFLGIDPESLHFDLGNDPLTYARKRFDIARDLVKRQEARGLQGDDGYTVLRRSVRYAVLDAGIAAGILARQIGGVRTLRDFPGSGRDPLQPVDPTRQREALNLLATGVFAADAFIVSPTLQRRLAPDFLERADALYEGSPVSTDYSVAQSVVDLQRSILGQLMSDAVATRILDSEGKAGKPVEALRLSELYDRLTHEIWSELGRSGDIVALRRELQREHANRVAAILLRPTALSRADARSLTRVGARALLDRIQLALKRGSGLSPEARAHLQDSAETLSLALSAKLQRAGT